MLAYLRFPPVWVAQQREEAARRAADGSTWLFSSSEAVQNLCALLPAASWQAARALATHPRIAQAAREAGFGRVRECSPRIEDVIAALESAR